MVIGPTKLFGKGIFFLSKFILRYWWVALTLFIIISGLSASISEGVEQQDLRIPLKYLGTTIVSSDEGIYEVVQDLEFEPQEKGSLSKKIGYYIDFGWYLIKNLWQHLWMIFFWFYFFFKGEKFLMGDDSKSLRAFIFAILTMTGLQILAYGLPFKGLFSLGKFIIGVM